MNETVQEQGAARGNSLALWAAVALVLAGVVGYYLLGNQPGWVRWLVVAGGFAAGGAGVRIVGGWSGIQAVRHRCAQ